MYCHFCGENWDEEGIYKKLDHKGLPLQRGGGAWMVGAYNNFCWLCYEQWLWHVHTDEPI